MFLKIGILLVFLTLIGADKDGKRWVWSDNNRNEARNRDDDLARYQVFENNDASHSSSEYNEVPLRPGFGGNRPYRPPVLNERPGGVYGGGDFGGGYGEGQSSTNYFPAQIGGGQGILTGPVPSWIKQGPIKNFDRCKCAAKFNCNSPGISYGHCDVGKQYCCYVTDKQNQLGEPLPSTPVHSIENGILVGPGGPVDPIPGVNVHPRPPLLNGNRPGGFLRPGGNFLRPGGNGFGLTPSGTLGSTNTYSPQNGILVGPGGPFDRPYRGGYGRSA